MLFSGSSSSSSSSSQSNVILCMGSQAFASAKNCNKLLHWDINSCRHNSGYLDWNSASLMRFPLHNELSSLTPHFQFGWSKNLHFENPCFLMVLIVQYCSISAIWGYCMMDTPKIDIFLHGKWCAFQLLFSYVD